MIKSKYFKIIPAIITVAMIAGFSHPFVAQAQISRNPINVFEDDVSTIGTSVEDIATDCAEDALKQGLTNFIGGPLKAYFQDFFSGVVTDVMSVPVKDSVTRKNTGQQTAKEVGIMGVSLDSIGYCLANKTLEGLVAGTAEWVQNGFGGNPIFIDNPGRHFGDLAKYELQGFLQELKDNLICVNIDMNTVRNDVYRNYYNRTELKVPRCILGEIDITVENYSQSDFTQSGGWDAWHAYTTDPYSNHYGTQLALNDRLNDRIGTSQATARMEADWNDGTRSIRDEDGNITTTGKTIQAQVEARLNAPLDRLTFADEFDEIMNALIDRFINVAIGEVERIDL